MSSINTTIAGVRLVLARAGERDRLNWWPSQLFSQGRTVLERLFPKTHQDAGHHLLSYAIRQKDGTLEPRAGLLGLFYFGVERETVLAQTRSAAPETLLERRYANGEELAEALLAHYFADTRAQLLRDADALSVNEAYKHIEVAEVKQLQLSERELEPIVGKLIAGLRLSEPGRFIPPVVRINP